jgi:hypothetical protein
MRDSVSLSPLSLLSPHTAQLELEAVFRAKYLPDEAKAAPAPPTAAAADTDTGDGAGASEGVGAGGAS